MRKFSKVEQTIVGTRDAFSPSLTKTPVLLLGGFLAAVDADSSLVG